MRSETTTSRRPDPRHGADDGFLDRTIGVWQPRSERTLTREDARQIIENTTELVQVLLEWEAGDRAAGKMIETDVAVEGSPRGRRTIE